MQNLNNTAIIFNPEFKTSNSILSELKEIIGNANSIDINIEKKALEESRVFFILPEWNGSLPWMFKKFIDDSGYPSMLENKNVTIISYGSSPSNGYGASSHLSDILLSIGAMVSKPILYRDKLDLTRIKF